MKTTDFRNFLRREPGPVACVAFIVFVLLFTMGLVVFTEHTWAEWWINFREG